MTDDRPVTLRWVTQAAELRQAQDLRIRVFCDEQGVPRELEVDDQDAVARHGIAATPDGRVVGTIRLIVQGTTVKVGRVAVDAAFRGRGIASALLDRAVEYAQDVRAEELRLAAQLSAASLYERAGFRRTSEPFDEPGTDIPHVWMAREVVPRRPRRAARR